ncbi:uncharacterized protein N7473_000040 [Penicillium subrubescens]|uniref:uncharacterized protein n=1 Tax=Penicillium subrubescens TaxID=1316194 RepID=UPI0025456D3F|nr:uncharacterized protein N7473_000040 [Penicillium subrubescens]KAJ5910737.1 hypothetical protein N7473_000040 [Penicillium subrubescens]
MPLSGDPSGHQASLGLPPREGKNGSDEATLGCISTGLVNMGHAGHQSPACIPRNDRTPDALWMLAWHIFGKSYATRGGAMIRTIQRIQRRAAQIIPGGFRTTAGAAVDVGFHLPPVQLQLEQNAVEATMGIRTTPLYDDMASTEAGRDEPGRPLQRRSEQSAFDRLSRILETKHGVRLELLEKQILRIYTDGSCINGHVGAAAVIPAPQVNGLYTNRTQYMGTSCTLTVYAAELKGLVLELQIILDTLPACVPPNKRAVIFTDNQAAIQAILNPKHTSGQYILAEAVRALDERRRQGWEMQFRWISAHVGVPGNEAADQAAKEAAESVPNARANAEPPPEPDSLWTLIATAKSTIRRAMKNEWEQAWEKCKP